MSYSVDNIIPITTRIVPQGLGFANFAAAVLFAPNTELPGGFSPDTYREYTSLNDLSTDFNDQTETYAAAQRWLGGIPATRKLIVWGVDATDLTVTETLNKARDELWWFWSFFDQSVYADAAVVDEIAQWSEANETFFMNCQTGTLATAIRDPQDSTDIASTLTTSGYRYTATFTHATDPYAGIALCKWFASVNYSATNSTITGEGKKLSGVVAEDLTSTAYQAMTQQTKKSVFYTVVELQGNTDNGRVINSWTHSTYGEFIDDVVNLAAFINALKVTLYNTIMNQPTKLGQDVVGQSVIIGAAREVCEQFIANGYLGARNYTDPDDGLEKFTAGYEILTKPEDILDLLEPDRDARKSAPLRVRVFRKGAIHQAPVDIDVY